MSWNLLERFIESEHFNKDASLTVAYLARYADHVGIHFHLCSKLRQFSYEEIEFFLPQLCHLLISIDNESMALEEFIIDLCEESVNGALLTFWLFQTYLHDLQPRPASHAFQSCRRLYNKLQRIVFGGAEPARREKIQENVLPVTVLSSLVLGSVGLPALHREAGPLAVAQARRPRPIDEVVSDEPVPPQKLGRSHTVTGNNITRKTQSGSSEGKDGTSRKPRRPQPVDTKRTTSSKGPSTSKALPGTPRVEQRRLPPHRQSPAVIRNSEGFTSTSSLPDQPRKPSAHAAATSVSLPGLPRRPSEMGRRHSHALRPTTPSSLSYHQRVRMLRQNYFSSEMQLLNALEGISERLVSVPKPARLSALRAELALIGQDLPAEVDIPLICPPTLVEGAAGRSRHHRIVRLNPAEATSLNSAEKVPYLLMLEVLRDDFDFDPESDQNQRLLAQLQGEKGKKKRKLFDTSDSARATFNAPVGPESSDSVFEPTNGDLSSPALLQDFTPKQRSDSPRIRSTTHASLREPPRLSSGVSTISSVAGAQTPRSSEGLASRPGSPARRPSPYPKSQGSEQPDPSALATHMRTAAQMLAQLELSTSKRPKTEVAAIRARIIASMQSLEEQSFVTDDAIYAPSFDAIMAKAGDVSARTGPADLEDDELEVPTDPNINTGRGADRMENDMRTAGVQRKGDRDDPSAATFGEAWEQKKERIRRSSPYGWVTNWDLISVIVKTGADLRQESFACQLIAVCSKIWQEHNVDVWIRNMRILVTGESSGLIETITNGVSLHSLKRSLTLASIANGSNPRKRIATLTDHFAKTFGATDSLAYTKALRNFTKSLAAYSTISYILQLKDRHNGNILIDSEGHIVHIDFGFMFSNSPGNMGFEAAPFKLTHEYIELLGGLDSPAFAAFKDAMKDAFQALRREAERIVTLVELMGRESKMPCYGGGLISVVSALRARFVLEKSKEEARELVEDLIAKSAGSYYTRLYDTFQYRTQGIY